MARIIEQEGRETVAAVIVDPVMAAAGVLVPPRSYYQRLREICSDDVLLIFDEVLTGFGRTGHWFAADYYGVVPDIICLGKGMCGGFVPLAAMVARGTSRSRSWRVPYSSTFIHFRGTPSQLPRALL